MAMAWMSIKQYAIIKGAADEGDAKAKEVLDAQMNGASQDELNKKMDEFFGSSTGSKASSKYEEKHPSWSHPLANGLMSEEQGQKVYDISNGEEEGDYHLAGEISEGNKRGRSGNLEPLNQEEIDDMLDMLFSDTSDENLMPSNIKRAKLTDNVYNHLVDASNNAIMESYWNDPADNLRNAWASGASQEEVDKLVNDFIDAEVKRTGFAYGMEKIQKKEEPKKTEAPSKGTLIAKSGKPKGSNGNSPKKKLELDEEKMEKTSDSDLMREMEDMYRDLKDEGVDKKVATQMAILGVLSGYIK